jgi:3-hydroxymyristoyl/3-hydroxydecanoyl-(acyl carrier protein) dehydratase
MAARLTAEERKARQSQSAAVVQRRVNELIIESMAQVGGMLLMRTIADPSSKVVYFLSLDNVKFRRPVKPGDQLRIEMEVLQLRGMMCKMRGVATVDGQVVTEADMSAMVRDR